MGRARQAFGGTARALAGTAALVLAGCGSDSAESLGLLCPDAAIVGELSKLSRFGGQAATPDALAFYGEIVGVTGNCAYDDDIVAVELQVSSVFDRPPGGPAVTEPVPYFVAVTRPDGAVVGKQELTIPVEFRDGEIRAGFSDEVTVELPLPGGRATGGDYRIYLGFQLTQAELDYNRRAAP
ncbi:MAG: hypothetical protein R3F55_16700 [Alphaproteobacteria bacterium]